MSTDFRALCAELLDELVFRPVLLDRDLIDRARAALAEQAAEPPAAAKLPSDEELRDLWSWAAGQDQGPWPTQYHCFALAVLARWGRPAQPAPPAEGEVAELVNYLRGIKSLHCQRAAELLERHAAPVPVPVSDRPWERKGWCDEQGRCWFGREESDYWSANWTLGTPEEVEKSCTYAPRTVCLPAHALPLPAPQGGEVE